MEAVETKVTTVTLKGKEANPGEVRLSQKNGDRVEWVAEDANYRIVFTNDKKSILKERDITFDVKKDDPVNCGLSDDATLMEHPYEVRKLTAAAEETEQQVPPPKIIVDP